MCRAARQAREEAQEKLQDGGAAKQSDSTRTDDRHSPTQQQRQHSQSGLDVASQLGFTPISLVWKGLSYYVPAPKNLTGAAAKGVVQKGDTKDEELIGKKQLLHDITGALLQVLVAPLQVFWMGVPAAMPVLNCVGSQ